MKRIGLMAVVCAALITGACDRRNDANDTAAVGTSGEDRDDRGSRKFVEDMIGGNTAEVKLGEIGMQKSRNPEVKAFAQMLVQDHSKAVAALKEIAAQHNIQPPTEPSNDTRDLMERLSKLNGMEFDREYIEALVDKHENTVDALEPRVDSAGGGIIPDKKSGPVKAEKADNQLEAHANQWAAKALPTVRHHLEKAKQINANLKRQTTNY